MLKVGITGGIGSGKTTVCRIFELMGIPVYYADQRAKALMTNDKELVQNIQSLFGKEAYINGQLNRKYIANIVFKNKDQLHLLNGAVHPALGKDFLKWVDLQSDVPYVVEEAAIMIESGNYKLMDQVILVTAPLEVKIKRIKNRDQASRQEILNRINSQLSDEDRMPYIDHIIQNDNKHHIIPQIIHLHKTFLNIS